MQVTKNPLHDKKLQLIASSVDDISDIATNYLKLDCSNDPLTGALTITPTANSTSTLNVTNSAGTSVLNVDTTNGRVGIGVASPSQQLDISQNIKIPNTTNAATYGIIYKGTDIFIHDFNYGDNGVATTIGGNLFIGAGAGNLTMGSTAAVYYQSSNNLGIGSGALANLSTGYQNLAFGALAGKYTTVGVNTACNSSVYIGYQGKPLADGDTNEVIIGYYTIGNGSNSVTIGNTSNLTNWFSGGLRITGNSNIIQAIIKANATQTSPLIVAQNSSGAELFRIDSRGGVNNLGVGKDSLKNIDSGTYNNGFGWSSLYSNTTGTGNTALGSGALYSNVSGRYNVAVGYLTSYKNSTGEYNMALGRDALFTNVGGSRNIAIGYNALYTTTVSDLVAIGYNALKSNTTGTSNLAIGSYALDANTTGSSNTAIGTYSLSANTLGGTNTAIGYQAMAVNTIGGLNLAIGVYALGSLVSGNNNVGLGYSTLLSSLTGLNNVAIGRDSLKNITTDGSNNVAIGFNAGYQSDDGGVFIGYNAGYNETGSNTLYIANSNTTTPLIYGLFTGTGAGLTIHSQATDGVPLIVKGIASQASNLQEWQNSSGTKLSSVEEDGSLQTGAKRIKSMETSTGTDSVGDVEVHICNSSSDYVLTLPAHEAGREIRIINKNTGVATLTPTSGTIKGSSTEDLLEWESLILISDGSNWL